MKALLREPLVHFTVLGAVLFALFAFLDRGSDSAPDAIVVRASRIEYLRNGFARTWQREPTADELDALIDDYVVEEALYREARKLRLDEDDTVIRRRLRQKMEFIAEDVAAMSDPTEAELVAHLAANPAKFARDEIITFRHVYLDPERHRGTFAADGEALLASLRAAGARAQIAELGDPFLLAREYRDAARREVESAFGAEFAARLVELPLGSWQGPVSSGYGSHIVLVEARTARDSPALAEVRDAVLRDWESERRLRANEAFVQSLLAQYSVTVERPQR